MERICLDKTASKAVDDYLEYRRIVGEDDGGRLFSPEEYEKYKRTELPQRLHNRLYVSFGVPGGIDCKLIGPETPCFCTHRYKQHQTDFEEVPLERPIALPCRVRGCRCLAFQYVHLNGSQPVRCRCKHSAYDHSETTEHLCGKCSSCSGFRSPFSCGCGQPSSAHQTLVETKAERESRGRPVGRDVPYAAMGGLTGFSSLADGYLRLDDSGAGAPPLSVLSSQQEHVFEKAYGPAAASGPTEESSVTSVTRALSDLGTREEEDMAYFERRYQERAEKMAAKQKASSSRGRPSTKPTTSLSSMQPTKQPTKSFTKLEKRTNS
ncbi:protein FAM221A-like [Coregonus clupeaformis]|uniref:protein FAM221A-like n=1 Tax=Coregonus clupeaformis TaxID=59861 RepID=UPI001BDFC238|nr:protein FAM221A-like [Coregonus clupeaformis]